MIEAAMLRDSNAERVLLESSPVVVVVAPR